MTDNDVSVLGSEMVILSIGEAQSPLRSPVMPSPPLSGPFLEIGNTPDRGSVPSTPSLPSPTRTTPFIEPPYRTPNVSASTSHSPSITPSICTPQLPSPIITTPFFQPTFCDLPASITTPQLQARSVPFMKPLPDTLFKTPLVPAPKPKVAGLPDLISPAFPSPPKTTAFITADTSPARPFASAISSSAVPRHDHPCAAPVPSTPDLSSPTVTITLKLPDHAASSVATPSIRGSFPTTAPKTPQQVLSLESPPLPSPPRSTSFMKKEDIMALNSSTSLREKLLRSVSSPSLKTTQKSKPGSLYARFFEEKENSGSNEKVHVQILTTY